MNPRTSIGVGVNRWIVTSFEQLILLISLGYVLLFIGLACLRAFCPFELEWTEGAVMDEINWVAQGHPLYGTPSNSSIPLIYGLLYFYLSAAVVTLRSVTLC